MTFQLTYVHSIHRIDNLMSFDSYAHVRVACSVWGWKGKRVEEREREYGKKGKEREERSAERRRGREREEGRGSGEWREGKRWRNLGGSCALISSNLYPLL